jgi:hypothetical protein
MAQATLAGAPPGALRKPVDSAKETPAVSGTKSMSISPNDTMDDTDGLIELLGLVAAIVIFLFLFLFFFSQLFLFV